MSKLPIIAITIFFGLNSYAQSTTIDEEAYINDPDGYTNVRDGQSGSANIITTIKTGELFNFQPSDQSNWWSVTKNDGTSGYVHKSRIVSVSTKAYEISKLIYEIQTTNPNNVEFAEASNEELFIFAEKFPKSFVNAFHNSSEQNQQLIIDKLESPIHDMIDLRLVYQRINTISKNTTSVTKILEAIKVAGNKLNLDVTK
ncbi:MAG: SH3 domain-containing protein [Cyclobacteriaceae bacterium]